ncbi:uncharacterized protein LOC110268208 [Arachis ipaensis]|uniref:uncharacterized protein LOC110268208 n=1 Tax=Arachis ipaensis TaxID=130454 RepID=UPI000A2B5579|nr:uncharacterized protein LOC110268208 [Arachis ipaensis]
MEAVGQYMQVIAARMLCIGHTTELLGAGEKEYMDKIALLEKTAAEKEKELSKRDGVIAEKMKKAKDQEEEIETLREQIRVLQSQVSQAEVEKDKMVARVRELEVKVWRCLLRALIGVLVKSLFFSPNFDVSRLDVTKIVVGGKFVNDDPDEAEGENVAEARK